MVTMNRYMAGKNAVLLLLFLVHDFLPYSESLRCGECYSVLQHHFELVFAA